VPNFVPVVWIKQCDLEFVTEEIFAFTYDNECNAHCRTNGLLFSSRIEHNWALRWRHSQMWVGRLTLMLSLTIILVIVIAVSRHMNCDSSVLTVTCVLVILSQLRTLYTWHLDVINAVQHMMCFWTIR